jgi:chromate transporter
MKLPMSQASCKISGGAGTPGEVFGAFFRLGLTSFGGPVAHLGYFRQELVVRRGWVDEARYAELVALGQLLPGPASSQVGFALGLVRAGWLGGLMAFAGFTLPSALLMVAFFAGLVALQGPALQGALHGLELVAVGVVAQAVFGMGRSLLADRVRLTLAGLALLVVSLLGGVWGQLSAIGLGLITGMVLRLAASASAVSTPRQRLSPVVAGLLLLLFFLLLLVLPLLAALGLGGRPLALFDAIYRSGALVFGGGHVVLPLLEEAVVRPGWVAPEVFIAGYAAAQAVPGPLFSFATFLGAASLGPGGAVLATIAVFAGGLLLMGGALPLWSRMGQVPTLRHAIAGANVAVVGILGAALFDPIGRHALQTPLDFGLAVLAYIALAAWRVPPWLLVAVAALGGALLALF